MGGDEDPKISGIVTMQQSQCCSHCWKLMKSKIFNINAVKDYQRFSLNLCHISKTPLFQKPASSKDGAQSARTLKA
jgi:hypothetical protein